LDSFVKMDEQNSVRSLKRSCCWDQSAKSGGRPTEKEWKVDGKDAVGTGPERPPRRELSPQNDRHPLASTRATLASPSDQEFRLRGGKVNEISKQ